MKKIAIIGAGIAGLTAAFRLSKKGHIVKIIEKEKDIGGVMGSVNIDGFQIEKYYHHVFVGDDELFRLVEELGIKNKMKEIRTKTGFYYKNKLYNLSGALDLIKYRPLSVLDRLRLGLFMLKIKGIKDAERYSTEPLREWVIKNSNERIYEKVFLPLLRSKYGNRVDDVSTAWFIERMKIRAQRGAKGETLIYMSGGFQQLLDRLQEEIIKNGGKILTGKDVQRITTDGTIIKKLKYDSKEESFDFVISTIPPETLNSKIDIPTGVKENEYQGALCILLGLKKSLCEYYWTNIVSDEKISFGAYIEHTNMIPKSEYGGNVISYLASYPDSGSDIWNMSDAEIFKKYFNDLKKFFDVSDSDVVFWKVFKTRYAGLVYKKGLTKEIMQCRTKIPNLFVCGMFNSYPERSINLSIKLANECACLVGD
ncbi:MAG: FAD-dependent oxidoreductase [Candidatus Aenigmatarchaeota archaeon]